MKYGPFRPPHHGDDDHHGFDLSAIHFPDHHGEEEIAGLAEADALDSAELERALADALEVAEGEGVSGAAVTPFVLERIGRMTEGRSVPANLALAEHNAGVAAEVAVAIAARARTGSGTRP